MNNYMRLAVLLTFAFSSFFITKAQKITAMNFDAIRSTKYVKSTVQDNIFIFFDKGSTKKDDYKANLKVETPSATGWKYSWTYYDLKTSTFKSFENVNKYDGITASIDTLSTGYYRLRLQNIATSVDTFLYAWVFVNKSNIWLNKNERSNCRKLVLNLKGEPFSTLEYYDIKGGNTTDKLMLTNGAKEYKWLNDKDVDPNIEELDSLKCLGDRMPFEKTNFEYYVVDSFGNKSITKLVYLPISAKADFKLEPKSGEAPLKVSFTPDCKNTFYYEWYAINPKKDTVMISEADDTFSYVFDRPGEYTLKLKAWNALCQDSIGFGISEELDPYKVLVDSVIFELPNAIVLNSLKNGNLKPINGKEDHNKSIRDIDVKIFTRAGKLVYEYSGLYADWSGWEGKRRGSNVDVTTGIYLYVIKIVGYDGISRVKNDFLYVFGREKTFL